MVPRLQLRDLRADLLVLQDLHLPAAPTADAMNAVS